MMRLSKTGVSLFYDHFGSADPDIIYSRIEYMALALEAKNNLS